MASFRVRQNVDQENKVSDFNRMKGNVQNQQKKRTVLGVLNKNATHKLPQKSIKQEAKAQDENALQLPKQPLQCQKIPFEIPEDVVSQQPEVSVELETKGEVSSCRTLPQRQPLRELPLPSLPEPLVGLKDEDIEKEKTDVEKEKALLHDEYAADIYEYLREVEERHRPRAGYMKKQPDITYSMRCILVDWLVEVAEEYRLQTETLYLAVSYIDRFLSYMSVVRAKLQLVGTAAMFIAAKYEEIYPPDISEFVYITDDTYTKKQVLRMEHLILKVLAFDLSIPTVLGFLTTFSTSGKVPDTVLFLAMYLSELTLVEGDPFLQYLPSARAAAAIALARHTLEQEPWPLELQTLSGYTLTELQPCIEDLQNTFVASATHPQQAIREKYKSSRWNSVSLVAPREVPCCTVPDQLN